MAEQRDDYPEHEVSKAYRDHYKRDWIARRTGNRDEEFPSAPFGSRMGHEYKWNEREAKLMKEVGVQRLPIQGPPNWSQIWPDWRSVGADFRTKRFGPNDIRTHSEKYTDLNFGRVLGEGAFGTVYEMTGRNIETNREERMACKFVQVKASSMTEPLLFIMNLILSDMYAIKYIKHENIVQMKDAIGIPDSQTGFPYACLSIFMELCDADLFELMDKLDPSKGMPEQYCWHWFRHICRALRVLHSDNIVHLDIKPENILYKSKSVQQPFAPDHIFDMVFKLADFGTSIQFQAHDEPFLVETRLGTEDYMSPELYNMMPRRPVQAKPCDIYSLGNCLAGCHLDPGVFDYRADNSPRFQRAYMHNTGPYNMVSKRMAEILTHMTRGDPTLRPTIDGLFASFRLDDINITN